MAILLFITFFTLLVFEGGAASLIFFFRSWAKSIVDDELKNMNNQKKWYSKWAILFLQLHSFELFIREK